MKGWTCQALMFADIVTARIWSLPSRIASRVALSSGPSNTICARAASEPAQMMFCISSTLIPLWLILFNVWASTPGRLRWRTTRTYCAGVSSRRLTQLQISPVLAKFVMMRTVSRAISSWACSVDAPM